MSKIRRTPAPTAEPLDQHFLADAIDAFTAAVQRNGLVNPHRLERRTHSEPPPSEAPPEEVNQEEVIVCLAALERIINPCRLSFDRPERVGWLLDLRDQEQTRWERGGGNGPMRWFDRFAVVAVAVHGLMQWWEVEGIATTEHPLAHTVERAVTRVMELIPLPIGTIRQLGVVATAIRTSTPPKFCEPRVQTLTAENLPAANEAARKIVYDVSEIHRRVRTQCNDLELLWRLDRITELLTRIPSAGWEPAVTGTAFQADGQSGRCAHLAVIRMAERIHVITFGNAISEAQRHIWGRSIVTPVPLGWIAEARQRLADELANAPRLNVSLWGDQLDIEFGRMRQHLSEKIAAEEHIELSGLESNVLRLLRAKNQNVLMVDLAVEADCAKATLQNAVEGLEKKGLAHRPHGERKGVAATKAGRNLKLDE